MNAKKHEILPPVVESIPLEIKSAAKQVKFVMTSEFLPEGSFRLEVKRPATTGRLSRLHQIWAGVVQKK